MSTLSPTTAISAESRLRAFVRAWLHRLRPTENRIFLTLAVVIGALTGLAVVAFILVSERFGMRLYPVGSAPWRRFTFPVVGSLGIGYLIWRYFPEARGSGVPQTKAALFARNGTITLRTVLGKFVCTSATIASGIPLGREGPSVQVGAGIGSILGRLLGLRPDQVQRLIPVGAAAAVAAAFNTPLAAIIFSLEEIMGDLQSNVMGAVVLASATAWIVLRLSLGNQPLFKVPAYQLVSPWEFLIYAVLGLIGGVISAVFGRILLAERAFFLRLPRNTGWAHPLAGGLLVGTMGLFVPQVLGVGYEYVGQALNNHIALKVMLLLIVLKLFAVTLSFGSGNAGGIFGPALFIGAMTGASLGYGVHHLFPAYTALPGAYALVGMGALFAGIIRAPMTSVLMIFEITQDYNVIVPLMIANMISLYVATRLEHESIYETIAIQDGIHLPTALSRPSGQRRVSTIMQPAAPTLAADLTLAQALTSANTSSFLTLLIEDANGICGVMTVAQLDAEAAQTPDRPIADLLDPLTFPHVHSDQGLDLALERMGTHHLDLLPVVSRANIHQILGVVTLPAVLATYGVAPAPTAESRALPAAS